MIGVRSPRTRGTRRRRDTTPPRRVLMQAAIGTAVVLGLVWLSLSIYGGVPWVSYKTIYATVPQTGNMIPHDPVKIGGVPVGQVIAITVNRAGEALLQLQLDPGTKVPQGTTFKVRANGLLGSRYVQLIPGSSSRPLPVGAVLHGNANSLTYGVPDAINVLDHQTRGALGTMVTGLGQGLLGRGPGLNDTIHEIAAESIPAQRLVGGLVGAGQLGRLVPSLESLMSPLNTARYTITAMLNPASTTAQPFVDQRAAVQATFDQAPAALDAANAGLANGERLLTAADALSVQARAILPSAPPGLKATTLLLAQSHPALIRARALLATAKPSVPAVLRITQALSPVLSPLNQTFSRASSIFNTAGPYACNTENFAAVIRSMTGFGGAETVPGGPGGPAMAFRLEVISAPPQEILGVKDTSGLYKRVGYAAPCHYLATTYPTSLTPLSGLQGQGG
jgi:virulence factor Mce-like protein